MQLTLVTGQRKQVKISISHLFSPGLPGRMSCLETGMIKICTCCSDGLVLGSHYSEAMLGTPNPPHLFNLVCSKKCYSDISHGVS